MPKQVEYEVQFEDGTSVTVWSKKGETQAIITARLQARKFDGRAEVKVQGTPKGAALQPEG